MRVVGIAGADFQAFEETVAQLDIAAQVSAILAQADADGFGAFFFPDIHAALFLVVPCTGADRNTVEAIVDPDRETEARIAAEECKAAVRGPGFGAAVEQRSPGIGCLAQLFGFFEFACVLFLGRFLEEFGAQAVGKHEAGNLDVVGFAIGSVGVEYETVADRDVEGGTTFAKVGHRVDTYQRIDMYRLGRNAARDALVDHIDGAADRLAAVKEHCRSAQDLDALGGQGIDRYGVIGRSVRHVDRADPVDEDLHALAGKAAQDRA